MKKGGDAMREYRLDRQSIHGRVSASARAAPHRALLERRV